MGTQEISKADVAWMEGPMHEVRSLARARERRGEIRVGWGHSRTGTSPGRLALPYVPLVSREELRWRARRRHALWAGSSLVALYGLWSVRWVVLSLAAIATAGWVWRAWRSRGTSITVVQSVKIRTK